MVSLVFEGYVETRGVLQNNAYGAGDLDGRVLQALDDLVWKHGGKKRKERRRRIQFGQRKRMLERRSSAPGGEGSSSGNKRDTSGNSVPAPPFQGQKMAPPTLIPDYLMPLYQVNRAPIYTARAPAFHDYARLAYERETKAARGYVPSHVGPAAEVTSVQQQSGDRRGADASPPNPANNVFLAGSKLPYTLLDRTEVEITNAARCDIAELFFSKDEVNAEYRDQVFDETIEVLEGYEREIKTC